VEALAARHRLAAVDRFFVRQRERGGVRTLCSSRPVRSALRSLESAGGSRRLPTAPGDISLPARNRAQSTGARFSSRRRADALVLPGVSTFAADGALEIDFDRPFALGPGP